MIKQKLKLVHQNQCQNQKKIQLIQKKLLKIYGADAARLFILSDSPPEKDVQWSDEGINSSYKFIQKLWNLNQKIIKEILKNHKKKDNEKNLENIQINFKKNVHKILKILVTIKLLQIFMKCILFLIKLIKKNI